VETARYFCVVIETYQSDGYHEFLSLLQKQLIQLYTLGQELPEFELPKGNTIEEVDITDKDIKDILVFIGKRLRDPFYWVVLDPTDHDDTSSGCGDLIDDLGDIYKDLKTFLIGFDSGDPAVTQNALWHLHWSFTYHWKDHCMDAIYAIHHFMKSDI
jgi:Domain of unknown function (DUF5063)